MARDIVLVAHNIRSLWNIGSFFRTADAFGVRRVVLSGYTSLPTRPEVRKTALGAEEWIPWEKVDDPLPLLRQLRADGYTIASLEIADDSVPLPSVQGTGPICLVLGHEILGVPKEILSLSDTVIAIPMLGRKHSLNVSVAAGIALYHLSQICS